MALGNRERYRNTALKLSKEEVQRHMDSSALRALRKGHETEDFVKKAIDLLKYQGWIQWYLKSQRLDELDMLGVDFLLMFSATEIIPLQVKSSEMGKEKHIALHGNSIPCVVLYPHDTVDMMAMKIMMAIFPDLYKGEPEETPTEILTVTMQEMLD